MRPYGSSEKRVALLSPIWFLKNTISATIFILRAVSRFLARIAILYDHLALVAFGRVRDPICCRFNSTAFEQVLVPRCVSQVFRLGIEFDISAISSRKSCDKTSRVPQNAGWCDIEAKRYFGWREARCFVQVLAQGVGFLSGTSCNSYARAFGVQDKLDKNVGLEGIGFEKAVRVLESSRGRAFGAVAFDTELIDLSGRTFVKSGSEEHFRSQNFKTRRTARATRFTSSWVIHGCIGRDKVCRHNASVCGKIMFSIRKEYAFCL